MRNISDKFVEKIEKHIVDSTTHFAENRVVHDIMWKNMVEPDRPHIA
jgi:hypothetical protein